MTLEALGRQYAAEADTLGEVIASCDKRRRVALRAGNRREAKQQERKAAAHAQQQQELLRIATYLRHYYDRPDGEASCEDSHTGLTKRGTWVHI